MAQTLYQSQVLRIWKAEAIAGDTDLEPGIVSSFNKHIEVATGKGLLRLHEVQLPGGKRLSAQAFLNAHDVNGVRLG